MWPWKCAYFASIQSREFYQWYKVTTFLNEASFFCLLNYRRRIALSNSRLFSLVAKHFFSFTEFNSCNEVAWIFISRLSRTNLMCSGRGKFRATTSQIRKCSIQSKLLSLSLPWNDNSFEGVTFFGSVRKFFGCQHFSIFVFFFFFRLLFVRFFLGSIFLSFTESIDWIWIFWQIEIKFRTWLDFMWLELATINWNSSKMTIFIAKIIYESLRLGQTSIKRKALDCRLIFKGFFHSRMHC